MPTDERIDTRCVHAGELHDPQGSPHTPIYTSTTFAIPAPLSPLRTRRLCSTSWRVVEKVISTRAMLFMPTSA